MKSVRLDETLESRLREAAKLTGSSMSDIIRKAVEEKCDRILKQRLAPRLADVVGIVSSEGGRARQTGKKFREALQRRKEKRR